MTAKQKIEKIKQNQYLVATIQEAEQIIMGYGFIIEWEHEPDFELMLVWTYLRLINLEYGYPMGRYSFGHWMPMDDFEPELSKMLCFERNLNFKFTEN